MNTQSHLHGNNCVHASSVAPLQYSFPLSFIVYRLQKSPLPKIEYQQENQVECIIDSRMQSNERTHSGNRTVSNRSNCTVLFFSKNKSKIRTENKQAHLSYMCQNDSHLEIPSLHSSSREGHCCVPLRCLENTVAFLRSPEQLKKMKKEFCCQDNLAYQPNKSTYTNPTYRPPSLQPSLLYGHSILRSRSVFLSGTLFEQLCFPYNLHQGN